MRGLKNMWRRLAGIDGERQPRARRSRSPRKVLVRSSVAGIGLTGFVLGFLGFQEYLQLQTRRWNIRDSRWWEIVYRTLQLLFFDSGAFELRDPRPPELPSELPWKLHVARFLAPIPFAYTIVAALIAIFSESVQSVRLRFTRDHVVICGLGSKGSSLAMKFRSRGDRVVVIEKDGTSSAAKECRERGAIVLLGDATDPEMLRKAMVHKAKYLISVCGADGANAEVAASGRRLVGNRRRRNALTCVAHIVDPHLGHLLRPQQLGRDVVEQIRLDYFSIYDRGAQVLLSEHPAFHDGGSPGNHPPHLLVIGLGRFGESLVLHAARKWHADRATTGERLRITVVDSDADQKAERLRLQHPQLPRICELIACSMDMDPQLFQRSEALPEFEGPSRVTAVYICLHDDSSGLTTALSLLQRAGGRDVPTVVRMSQDAGLAALLRSEASGDPAFKNLRAFGLVDRTCKPELVLGGTYEVLARSIHEHYVRHQETLGQVERTNSSIAPWDSLPENLRESNRRHADHIGEKLNAIDYDLTVSREWDAGSFAFTPEQVERMARLEHQHWLEERSRQGWSYAPGPKDLERKTNPYMVDWDELPEDVKEVDRNFVRVLPSILAKAGLQVYRTGGKLAPQTGENDHAAGAGASGSSRRES